jgi:hypothetical protein
MLKEELEVARAWAQQGRDRDLLDVLAATASDEHDPDTEILLHPRCRQRFAGDGWTTLCSKLARRLAVVGGFEPAARPCGPGRAGQAGPRQAGAAGSAGSGDAAGGDAARSWRWRGTGRTATSSRSRARAPMSGCGRGV